MRGSVAILLALALAAGGGTAAGAGSEGIAWQHLPSPYRAEFRCRRNDLPDCAGVALTIPDCGTSHRQGGDVFCFDQDGRRLLQRPVGKGIHNTVLLLARPERVTRRILAYWGSGMGAPAARIEAHAGLLAEMLTFDPDPEATTWEKLQPALRKARSCGFFQLPDKACVVENPVDSRDAFILRIRGFLRPRRDWKENWFVAADDSGYLLLDGALQIARPGRNHVHDSLRGEYAKTLSLAPGLHRAELIGVNFAGRSAIALGKLPPGGRPEPVTAADFVAGAEAVLERAGGRDGAPVPLFTYRHLSYLSLPGRSFTETEYRLRGPGKAEWRFADGMRTGDAASLIRVHLSLDSMPLEVRCGKRSASGQVDFPSRAPERRASPDDPKDYEHYARLLKAQWDQGMRSPEVLPPLVDFLLRRDLRAETIPVLEAALQGRSLTRRRRRELLLALARCASVRSPDLARKCYGQLLSMKAGAAGRAELVQEALEFAVFRLRAPRLAEQWLRRNAPALHDAPQRLAALKMDLADLKQDREESLRCGRRLQGLQRSQAAPDHLRRSVQNNELRERIEKALRQDEILHARELLRKWPDVNPACPLDAAYTLLRARTFRKMNWLPGALDCLESAIQRNPLLPNLPNAEMLKADLLNDLGQTKQAQELYRKITTEYPNHPNATRASILLKSPPP